MDGAVATSNLAPSAFVAAEMRASRYRRFDVLCGLLLVVVISASIGITWLSGTARHAASDSAFLPFDLPTQAVLKGSPKKVFANYFPVCPISLDNLDSGIDYYTEQYLDLNGDNSNFAADGAVLRERPLPRPVDPSPDWALNDMKTEVRRATSAGLDGFVFDVLALDGIIWDRLLLLLEAAPLVDSQFKIMLMPDGAALATVDVEQLAQKIASLAAFPALFRLGDGRLVISPFAPENQGAAWWTRLVGLLQTKYDIPVAFVPTFLDYDANVAAFESISYGLANWGSRSTGPAIPKYLAGFRDDAHRRGKIWMQPVSLQDNRPRAGMYWEANNTENLRTTWSSAIDGADWAQVTTWNDYTENSQVSPSTHIGWGPLDIMAFYVTQFKQGKVPPIVRDVVYVSHRVQPHDLIPTNQQRLMTPNPNSAPPRDAVEVLSFLVADATVDVEIGTRRYTYQAPAGVFAMTYPLGPGTVDVRVSRSQHPVAEVASRFPIVSRRATQDLQYYFVSSRREPRTATSGP